MAVGEVKNRCRDLVRQVVLTSLSVMSRKPTPLIDVTRREMLADGHVAAGRGPRRHGPPRLCPRQVQAKVRPTVISHWRVLEPFTDTADAGLSYQ